MVGLSAGCRRFAAPFGEHAEQLFEHTGLIH